MRVMINRNNNGNLNGRYPEGYKPKIEYWEAKYYMALEEGIKSYRAGNRKGGMYWNEKAAFASEKMMYFKMREKERMSEVVSDIW
jgi:hypothetical protein